MKMGLISKTAMVKWNSKNKAYYEEKGYIFTKFKDEFEVNVEDLTNGSKAKVDIRCDCPNCKDPYLKNIVWKNYKKCVKKDGKYFCNKCSIKLFGTDNHRKTSLKNGKSFQQWCYDNLSKEKADEILNRWDYELNGCFPNEICYTSKGLKGKEQGYWFKCPKGIHKSELKIIPRFVNGQEGSIYCNQCNSFAQWGIDNVCEDFLEKYWDYDKNVGINPWKLNYGSRQRIFIKCQNIDYHGSYNTSCHNFSVNERGCPYCAMKKIHPKDSLGQYLEDNNLLHLWSDKNKESPFQYSPKSSRQYIWWKCPDEKHGDYRRKIEGSENCNFRCPDCVRERDESFLQEKVRLYLEGLGYNVLHENRCTIVPKNPKTKFNMPFDNEIKELRLVIEVMGIQHTKISGFHKMSAKRNKTTTEYELHMQQVRDRYKKIFAYIEGYNYLQIPYWTDNTDNEWKQLIDNKIQEILKLSA